MVVPLLKIDHLMFFPFGTRRDAVGVTEFGYDLFSFSSRERDFMIGCFLSELSAHTRRAARASKSR